MQNVAYWKIIRVLTTDTCNFDCVFCHNEGQVVKSTRQFLSLDEFVKIILALKERPLKEIQFSGGEPFLNPDTIKMIEWAHKNTDYEIGCATNMSLLNDSLIKRLSNTRLTYNIQFPSNNTQDYNKITNSLSGDSIISKIFLLKELGIKFKLNFVWLKENIEPLSNIIEFCLEQNFGLKILPFISEKTLKQNHFKKLAINYMTPKLGQPNIKVGGALRWEISNGDEHFVIKFVDSPCFDKDFNKCRDYAEIRLLPNLQLQSCLLKSDNISISKEELNSSELIINKMDLLWKNFTNC
ncbi:MAG: radical SAM protein [Labilibaculum sp.]|nr:radical SAM protein [Labilibaculum sp.]MBI9060138.1 radical SAM protein [Labilibaculum sp.]